MPLRTELTLSGYIEHFIDAPEASFGSFATLASAIEKNEIGSLPGPFCEFVSQVALAVREAAPVLVCCKTRQEAEAFMQPLGVFFSQASGEPLYTYAWKPWVAELPLQEAVPESEDTDGEKDEAGDQAEDDPESLQSASDAAGEEEQAEEAVEEEAGGEDEESESTEPLESVEPQEKTAGGDATDLSAQSEEESIPCPYRHDPVLLLPEKVRQEVLSDAGRHTDYSAALALESKRHCPLCTTHYQRLLGRSEGIWQRFAEQVEICEVPPVPEDAPLEERIAGANRGFLSLSLADPGDLKTIPGIMKGNETNPPVVGLVMAPVLEETLREYEQDKSLAEALASWWILRI